MSGENTSEALDYSRRLFDTVVDWYKNADTKAQILLTLDGAFLAFLTTSIFRNPDEAHTVTEKFGRDKWVLLIDMCGCLSISIVCALGCLWSRVFLMSRRDRVLKKEKSEIATAQKYSANLMLFFRTISWLDHDKFREQLLEVDSGFEIRALASQIYLLSKRVNNKHV